MFANVGENRNMADEISDVMLGICRIGCWNKCMREYMFAYIGMYMYENIGMGANRNMENEIGDLMELVCRV